MGRFGKFALAGLPFTTLLASCSIVDVPVSTATGTGVASGSAIAFVSEASTTNELRDRVRSKIEMELVRAGYRIEPKPEYVVEFAIAKRPSAIGILLPEGETAQPEAGTWRSRPVDRNSFTLCSPSIYRLMIVISRESTSEIVFRGSSDDDICDQISEDKLRTMVASVVAGLRGRSMP